MRTILVDINAKEKTCGKCVFKYFDVDNRPYCNLFLNELTECKEFGGGNRVFYRCDKCFNSDTADSI